MHDAYPKNVCFLCGEALYDGSIVNDEHVLPKWVLKRFDKEGQMSFACYGQERQRQKLYSHKSPVHKRCNNRFSDKLEDAVSENKYSEDKLWLWCMKIVIGLRFCNYGHSLIRSQPRGERNLLLDEYPDDTNNFWEFSEQHFRNHRFLNTAMFAVLEIGFIFENPSFYYHINDELGTMMLILDERAFLIFFRDLLGKERLQEYRDVWNEMRMQEEDIEPQAFYNIFCARISICNYFAGYSRSFNFGGDSEQWVENRIPFSEEAEDLFYAAFHITPIREGGQIVQFNMTNPDP